MGSKLYHVLFWLLSLCSSQSSMDLNIQPSEDDWDQRPVLNAQRCSEVQPTARDIVRRVYAILPYFDKDNENTEFLQKFRVNINSLSEGGDILDREAAFYAAVATPLLFLQHYRDTWCLLLRLQHAMRAYKTATHAEKRMALKLLQSLRDVNTKVRSFISSLPTHKPPTARTLATTEFKDDDLRDKKDIRFLKELIKNLG